MVRKTAETEGAVGGDAEDGEDDDANHQEKCTICLSQFEEEEDVR